MNVQEKIKLLKALADETRIKIIQCLMDGERCACGIVPAVGKAQPTVSQHLKILEEAGILESRRKGTNIWYKIQSDQAFQIMKILNIPKIEITTVCQEEKTMNDTIIVFEGALCCSTGICGPEPDKILIEFNETLKKLKQEYPDLIVERASLTFNIDKFLENATILDLVKEHGPGILPITTINGKIVREKGYPDYESFLKLIKEQ